jgi:hypothetical protein
VRKTSERPDSEPSQLTVATEFQTVDIILESEAETRGVDAFVLASIKAERQIRKLLTHLIFQYPAFTASDVSCLRAALAANRNVYLEGLMAGFDAIYPRSLKDLGKGARLPDEATQIRNKIFHGQLTNMNLSREQLIAYVKEIRAWCDAIAEAARNELGYDGFGRNSFQKSTIPEICKRFRTQLSSVPDYRKFIHEKMERKR